MLARDGGAQGFAARNHGVVRIAGAQGPHGGLGDGFGRGEIRVAHAQHNHVLATFGRSQGSGVDVPGIHAFAGYAVHQAGKFHVLNLSQNPLRTGMRRARRRNTCSINKANTKYTRAVTSRGS